MVSKCWEYGVSNDSDVQTSWKKQTEVNLLYVNEGTANFILFLELGAILGLVMNES
jgi:hypothetical protein